MNGNCASHFGSGRVFDKFRKEVVLSEGGGSFDPGILVGIVLPEVVVGVEHAGRCLWCESQDRAIEALLQARSVSERGPGLAIVSANV